LGESMTPEETALQDEAHRLVQRALSLRNVGGLPDAEVRQLRAIQVRLGAIRRAQFTKKRAAEREDRQFRQTLKRCVERARHEKERKYLIVEDRVRQIVDRLVDRAIKKPGT